MKKLIRYSAGWLIAMFFVIVGKRFRCLKQYDKDGAVLSFFTHNPSPEVLDGVLKWLTKQGFTFLSTDEMLDMCAGKTSWRKRVAWLTFDDGWDGFEKKLLPILEKYHCPATIFVPPKEIERGQIWTNAIQLQSGGIKSWYSLPAQERYAKVDAILAEIGNLRKLMTESALRRLARHPLIVLENHTYTHLSCASRPVNDVVSEVELTQKILVEWSGRLPKLCCYPFGHCTNATDEAIVRLGLVPVQTNTGVMTLQTIGRVRNMFHETMSLAENVGRILGAWIKVSPLKAV